MGRASRIPPALGAALAALLAAVPVAGAQGGAPAGGAPYPSPPAEVGGVAYGTPLAATNARPLARLFSVSPRVVRAPRLPAVRFLLDGTRARTVAARLVFTPVRGGALARVDLGRVRARRVNAVRWPSALRVAPGRYVLHLQVSGGSRRPPARGADASARANLVVLPQRARRAAPAPSPVPAPSPSPEAGTPPGVFPVRGPHTYGDRFGAPRSGYSHQGQDVIAAQGTPVVAPVAGSILYVDYQASAAGWYVVQHADDGRDFFYAHCAAGTVAVTAGRRVGPGTRLCDVGATGDATGPHLHFEIWLNGWRASKTSAPVDPLPQLQAWDR